MLTSHRLINTEAAAITDVLLEWKSAWPLMGVMAFFPEKESSKVSVLQDICVQHNVQLLGGVFPALLSQAKFITEGVLLVCFELAPPYFFLDNIQDQGGQRIAQEITRSSTPLHPSERSRKNLFLVFDGMVGNINTLMSGVHLHLASPPTYSGINAGSETFQPMPCLFDQTRMMGGGVIGVFLPSPHGAIVRHAYPASKSLMRASSSQGNRIVSIDGRPAFEVYQEVIGLEYGTALTRENFYALAVHYPFGLVTVADIVVRIPVALGDDGSLVCVGEVPPDSTLHLLRAPVLEESTCVEELAQEISQQTRAQGLESLLTFYCAGRRLHFGERAEEELAALQIATRSDVQFGALTLGEIDSEADFDFPRFHNAAVVCFPSQRSTKRTQ